MSHDLPKPRDESLMWINGAITLSYNTAKCGGHWHSGSGDITFLVCHMISKYHVIKGSYDFMGWSVSW